MVQFIDDHRDAYGVESICTVVPIAPSTYFWHKARHADPTRRSARVQRDDGWRREIQRVWDDNQPVYGPRTVWRQLRREGHRVARCTVGRLMRAMGLRGAVRGRAWVTTTQADSGADRPVDLVDRHVVATRPNQLWVSAFTYVATWRGFVYVAFVIDVSGSMQEPTRGRYVNEPGKPRIEVAKAELSKAIEALEENALFNILPFSAGVEM